MRSDCVLIDAANGKNAYEQFVLTDLATGESRLVQDELEYCGGLGAFGLSGLSWSRDSRYFFYSDAREGVPDGGCLGWYRPAARLEVATGQITPLVQGPLSPSNTWEAGLAGNAFVMWNHATGEIIREPVAVAGLRAGALAWSPDGTALVYLQWTSKCVPVDGELTLVRYDLATRQQSMLLKSQTPEFASIVWDAPNHLRLFEADNIEWRYDLASQTLTRFK